MSYDPADHIQTAFEQLPKEVQEKIRTYISEGNRYEDLLDLYLNELSVSQISALSSEASNFKV